MVKQKTCFKSLGFHLGYPTVYVYFHHIESLICKLLCNFAQQQFLSPISQYRITLYNLVCIEFNFFFFLLSCVHVVGDIYLIGFFPSLRHECHPPSSCFILHFSWCFSQLLIVGKIQELMGVFSFMKMVGLLTCSTFLHVEDLGLHIYSCTSVLAYCRV